jgi:kumamolisin
MLPQLKPYHKVHAHAHEQAPRSANTPFFNVKQLASIYGFPPAPLTTAAVTVGVVSFGGGLYGVPSRQASTYVLPANAPNCDVQRYWTYLGYSSAQMPKVVICPNGGAVNNLADAGGTGENTLDVSIIGGCCPTPNLTILLFLFPGYYSFSQALPVVLAGLTVGGTKYVPTIISISWGAPEIAYLPNYASELASVNALLKTATDKGVNICAAAGDNGATDGNGTTRLSVDFPAGCPYVTALGGTSLLCASNVYDTATRETVWNNNNSLATGGGLSAYFSKPAYQTALASAFRNVPDIALNSDPYTGLILYLNGQLQAGWGGTSMAAPLFAGYLALIKPNKFVNPLLYPAFNSSNFHDIITGNNSDQVGVAGYSAKAGYDRCTGLGSINGVNLRAVLLPIVLASAVTLNVVNITLVLGRTFQLVATVAPPTTTNKAVTWLSSVKSVATVSASGVVTAKRKGKAVIRVATADGSNKYAYMTVTVVSAMYSIIHRVTPPKQ